MPDNDKDSDVPGQLIMLQLEGIQNQLNELSGLVEMVGRIDERLKSINNETDAIWKRLQDQELRLRGTVTKTEFEEVKARLADVESQCRSNSFVSRGIERLFWIVVTGLLTAFVAGIVG